MVIHLSFFGEFLFVSALIHFSSIYFGYVREKRPNTATHIVWIIGLGRRTVNGIFEKCFIIEYDLIFNEQKLPFFRACFLVYLNFHLLK